VNEDQEVNKEKDLYKDKEEWVNKEKTRWMMVRGWEAGK
jgi:hypothetical protein